MNSTWQMPGDPTQLNRLGEFDLIDRFFKPLAADLPGSHGLTDDAATLSPDPGNDLVVTTDTIVETVHFFGSESPASIASKLLRVNLSDLAAKGTVPMAYSLNLALPSKIDDAWLQGFVDGLAGEQKTFGIGLLGGDTVSTSGPLVLTATAIGQVSAGAALHRFGARAGDRLFVTGTIGDGALGLLAAQYKLSELEPSEVAFLRDRYEMPQPRSALGPQLLGLATAALDISDGLIADCGQLAAASGLAAEIETVRIPVSDAAASAISLDFDLFELVLTGGDDYEILFAAPESARDDIVALSAETGVPITEIGHLSEGAGVTARDADGLPVEVSTPGYRHT